MKWPRLGVLSLIAATVGRVGVLVHHTRKNAAGGISAGLGLRGSSDIHAFGDSNLYLRRAKEHLVLSTEHRAALHRRQFIWRSSRQIRRRSTWRSVAQQDTKPRGLEERVLDNLAGGMVLTRAKLRDCLAVKNERLGEVLESLERTGRLGRTAAGWQRLD